MGLVSGLQVGFGSLPGNSAAAKLPTKSSAANTTAMILFMVHSFVLLAPWQSAAVSRLCPENDGSVCFPENGTEKK